ncbi:ABC transporter ATP-binding protein [Rhizobium sp. SG570]|uniref:ABC transporter ATP-binding protein n=1 Tax=Rhizobium sp. SG570 TaxID=2587113 RepID=UPI001444EEC4|nr:ABC transporter ATP-binding protein [Rhizobium sp. SG570]NKJ40474.1 peptide/nickel transport system ATP-binding protein/oligopeptide transport system ATP-binding protein [Rhizobium sp. SG570]
MNASNIPPPQAALSVRDLTTTFLTAKGRVTAVDRVSFDVLPGEVLGLVGESGSGKSVTLRSIMRLVHAPGTIAGQVMWRGRNLVTLVDRDMRQIRGGEIGMIFQEPMTALNPVLSIGVQIDENLKTHTSLDRAKRLRRAIELMELVGIPEARRRLDDYPHQFSGGMRQRAMIAISLASNPKLLLADEPTTALDVTIQDQILQLILELKSELGMSVVFVTHDLGVVASICDRMAVMYAGRIVEAGPVNAVFAEPHHAYTRGLLGSVPHAGAERTMLLSIEGTPPSLAAIPSGCAFNPRCTFATDICREAIPAVSSIGSAHLVACHHHDRVAVAGGLRV